MAKKSKFLLYITTLILSIMSLSLLSTIPTFALNKCKGIQQKGECESKNGETCLVVGNFSACRKPQGKCYIAQVFPSNNYNDVDDYNKALNYCQGNPIENDSETAKEHIEEELEIVIPSSNEGGNGSDSGNSSGGSGNVDATFTGENCNGTFLGLISWCKGVNISSEETLKTGIWTIAANVATDITVIAAYLVLGFVIYGGYLYLLSGGDATKVANGKKTIANAFIGLGIVLSANIILTAIRVILIGKDNAFASCYVDYGNCPNPTDMVSSAIQWVIGVAGLVSAIFIVIGGVSYMTSSGEPAKLEKAKKTILYAVIGLAIVALAEIITAFVTNIIKDASTQAYQITNQTTISKEVHVQKNS